MNRGIEMAISALLLIILTPILIAIAISIKLSSRGPIMFRQTRVGLNDRNFDILKFRSMRTPGVAVPVGPEVTTSNDPRITSVGKALRSSKLDELPQLLNVLRGDMSLVGPRPEVPRYAAHWPAATRAIILSVRPGITDPASVRFRREAEILASQTDPESYYVSEILPLKASIYVEYVTNKSLRTDINLLVKTAHRVVTG